MKTDVVGVLAFGIAAVFVGGNFVAIRFSNMELDPFWGATIRFVPAAAVFLIIMRVRELAFPQGRAWWGPVVFGLLGVGAFFAFAYWGLVTATAATGAIILASVPLITFLLSWVHGLEVWRWRRLLGSGFVIAGVVLLATLQPAPQQGTSPLSVLALITAAICLSESSVLLKRLPAVHPITTNAIAFSVGSLLLLLMSIATGESWRVPSQWSTWSAVVYLCLFGSVVLFFILVNLIQRWGPSSTVYVMVASPLVAVVAGALLAQELVTWVILVSGLFVVIGVYIGVLMEKTAGRD